MRNVIGFHNPDEDYGFLSNWYLSNFVVDAVIFIWAPCSWRRSLLTATCARPILKERLRSLIILVKFIIENNSHKADY